MGSYNLSAGVFIRDTFKGAFCLFESMATLLPLVEEYVVLDFGSTDGTLEALRTIEMSNRKVRVISGTSTNDASTFADMANVLVRECTHETILYHQADEIWHENLIKILRQRLDEDHRNLAFWRIQYQENFSKVKWFPHLVHRVGPKYNFNFVDDGMNSANVWDVPICSTYGGEFFPRWGSMDPMTLPTDEMILDVSMIGAFLENIQERRQLHAPYWPDEPLVGNIPLGTWLMDQWAESGDIREVWLRKTSQFNIPKIMKWHLGETRYRLRPELLRALREDTTQEFLEGLK